MKKINMNLTLNKINSLSGEFGNSLGSFTDGVFAQFSRQDQFDGALNFPTAQSVFLVISDEFGGLNGDSVETVVDEGVHDSHGFLGNSGFRVHLLQHLVNVDSIRFNTSFASFLLVSLFGDDFGGHFGLRGGFFGWHFELLLLAQPKLFISKIWKNLEFAILIG